MLKANKGDLVRILEGASLCGTKLSEGDIVEISRVLENPGRFVDRSKYYVKSHSFNWGGDIWLWENEFELFRKAGEEDVELTLAVPEDSPAVEAVGCSRCGKPLGDIACGGAIADGVYCSIEFADAADDAVPTEEITGEFSERAVESLLEILGESDAVHHPSHYTQGKFETIEIIEAITQGYDDGYVAYSVGNALKYLARAPFKHASPIEDLRKAATYLEFAIKAYEAKEAE